jgi:hypothetical protein
MTAADAERATDSKASNMVAGSLDASVAG